MSLNSSPAKKINNILTAAAVIILMLWAWKWFGPGGTDVRSSGESALRGASLSLSGLISIGVAVMCGGYLLWRFLLFLFWRKYFNDENPPNEPKD